MYIYILCDCVNCHMSVNVTTKKYVSYVLIIYHIYTHVYVYRKHHRQTGQRNTSQCNKDDKAINIHRRIFYYDNRKKWQFTISRSYPPPQKQREPRIARLPRPTGNSVHSARVHGLPLMHICRA